MKEFVISEAQVETAILVGLVTQTQDERKTMEYLDESGWMITFMLSILRIGFSKL